MEYREYTPTVWISGMAAYSGRMNGDGGSNYVKIVVGLTVAAIAVAGCAASMNSASTATAPTSPSKAKARRSRKMLNPSDTLEQDTTFRASRQLFAAIWWIGAPRRIAADAVGPD